MSYSADATPDERLDELVEKLEESFEELELEIQRDRGELTLVAPREQWLEVATRLRDGKDFQFAQLVDLCGVDYATHGLAEWDTETASSTGSCTDCRSISTWTREASACPRQRCFIKVRRYAA